MCIIIVAPPHKTPDFDNIVQATYENDDGSGWVIRTPHGLELFRSAHDITSVIASFVNAREKWPNSWAVWHSRLATHGTIADDNTHPFMVPGQDWAMVHNGILPLSDGPFKSDRSDSRILAEDHFSTQNWADLRANKADVEHWLAGDKVVLISGPKQRGGPVIIYNEKRGDWEADECWYSHPLYWPQWKKTYTPSYPYSSTGTIALPASTPKDDDDWDNGIWSDAEIQAKADKAAADADWWKAQDIDWEAQDMGLLDDIEVDENGLTALDRQHMQQMFPDIYSDEFNEAVGNAGNRTITVDGETLYWDGYDNWFETLDEAKESEAAYDALLQRMDA